MARPAKSVNTIKAEGRSHRTKAEMESREKQEKNIKNDKKFIEYKEVKENKSAHKKFLELKALFSDIELNDALIGNPINRYCLLYSECLDFEKTIEEKKNLIFEAEERHKNGELDFIAYAEIISVLEKTIFKYDSLLMARRDMMFRIERESLMTAQSKLRAVPKKPPKDEEKENDPMNGYFKQRGGIQYG